MKRPFQPKKWYDIIITLFGSTCGMIIIAITAIFLLLISF